MNDLKIIFFGNPYFVVSIPQKLVQSFNLVAVVTNSDQKVGRKQIITPSPVKKTAQALQIPCFTPEIFDTETIESLKKLNPDLFVVAAYGKIIPQEILDIPKYGSLNVHPSLLPKYRGATPIQSAILNGDTVSGVTIYVMDEKMDHGPIIAQEEMSLSNQDTFETLSNKMFSRSAELLVEIIPDYIEGKLKPKEQNHEQASFCRTLKKENGYFDIHQPPSSHLLNRIIRAYFPWPNAWTVWKGKRIKFLPRDKEYLVQMEGKTAVPLKNFLNGYPDFPIKEL